jgi:hypothetical protein
VYDCNFLFSFEHLLVQSILDGMHVRLGGNNSCRYCFLFNSGTSESFRGLILKIDFTDISSVLSVCADYSQNSTNTH